MIKLNIQRFAREVSFIPIKATADGTNATTGSEMQVAFNTNFSRVCSELTRIIQIIELAVSSETITMIKADTQGKFYFTSDDPATPEEQVHWTEVAAIFANIQGDPYDNLNLATVLNAKASASDVSTLQTQMSGALQSISTNTQNIATNAQNIASHTQSINNINTALNYRVQTDGTQTPLYMKFDNVNEALYVSEDNTNWIDVSGLNTTWASITGNVTDNTDLVNYIAGLINPISTSLTNLTSTVTAHTGNTNNPHNVTKAQVGLGNVDNTSDLDKPISTAVQAALDIITTETVPTIKMTSTDYQTEQPGDNYTYFTSDNFDS